MKEVIALIWAISIVAATIYLHIRGSLRKTSLGICFAVAILGGLAIANYDIAGRFEGFGVKVETARREIMTAKTNALSEIEKEVAAHKDSISMLIRTGNELNDKLEKQKAIVTEMIAKAHSIETQLESDQKKLEEMKGQVVVAHRNSQAIFTATKELSLILTRISYVQAQTKNELGASVRLQKAAEIIQKDINRILDLMIPDLQERNKFVDDLTRALPSL